MQDLLAVTLAKAGVQKWLFLWIPACAGMTSFIMQILHLQFS
jgi:hypothetical protein